MISIRMQPMGIGAMILSLLLVVACGEGTGNVVESKTDVASAGGDAGVDVVETSSPPDALVGLDAPVGNDLAPEIVSTDGKPELILECDPGEGCFQDKCQENADCQSGWCVEHMGEGVCSRFCQDECPDGWSCQQVAGTFPDVVYICVSEHSNLCKPCSSGSECKAVGGAEDVCVKYGDEGSFCGGACAEAEDCPWGFSCLEVETVDGILTTQCVAEAGVCPCTGKSASLALWTPCRQENEFGLCTGKRFCAETGLTDCDAAVPAEETCNGLDDDCDELTDEPDEVGGDFVNLCDDDNECTDDSCDGDTGCQYAALEDGECMDGNPCTVADNCVDGVCVGDPVVCDDENPCTDNLCTETGGCEYVPNNADCDDGDPCTVGDDCDDGECVGAMMPCECNVDSDCAALEDGDICNGTLICDVFTLPHKCEVDPATTIICPEPQGHNAICLETTCDAATGVCGLDPTNDGFPCEDGDACTVADLCATGECAAGQPANCNDGNPCTADSCDAEAGCQHANTAADCEDGSVCTLSDQCVDGTCIGGEPLACDDSNPCTDDACDDAVGCVYEANDAPCSDGNACTINDACSDGQCAFSGQLDCNDGNPCTLDDCDPLTGCLHPTVEGGCSDGNPCTLNDACVDGLCVPGPLVNCDDGNLCTADSCGDAGLCLHEPAAGDCDDGNACTAQDHCQAGKCVFEGLEDCGDDNLCTTDTCDPAQGCVYELNNSPCDDEDVCTTADHCHLGNCISSGMLVCDDNNLCTDDACQGGVGCTFTPNSEPCDTGTECTENDICKNGMCVPGQITDCDDGNVCTTDSCDPETGCTHTANDAPCADGDACTFGDKCADKACQPGGPLNCNDGNICTDDSCLPDSGCSYAPNNVPCEDGNICTTNDACSDSQCVGGPAPVCSDDVFCNGPEKCEIGVGCGPADPPNTNDGIQCTLDSCDETDDVVLHIKDDVQCQTGKLCYNDYCDTNIGCVSELKLNCCGNGLTEAPEECDLGVGNANVADTCRTNCKLPDCPDGIKDAGEECDDGNSNNSDECKNNCETQDLITHYDGFNYFYNQHAVDVHSSARAIDACQNFWNKPCSVKGCGGAQYVVGNHDVNCSNGGTKRIWYWGNDGGGYVSGNQDYAGITIKPPNFSGQKNWY